jgi:hypothetical protein
MTYKDAISSSIICDKKSAIAPTFFRGDCIMHAAYQRKIHVRLHRSFLSQYMRHCKAESLT